MSGFSANVPVRKPRTKIARVISELTAAPAEAAPSRLDPPVVEDAPVPVRAADTASHGREILAAALVAKAADTKGARPSAGPRPTPPAATPLAGGHEQIARLRERLAAAAHLKTAAVEPKRTAVAVREVVDGLRERLDASARERSDLAKALEEANATLARAGAELQRERRAREALEAQAEERRRIADDAVAEAEALAAERDQVLGELTQHRRLEGEQAGLLTEVEAALAQRDAERAAVARELAEARDQADLHAAEITDLEARLKDETTNRERAEARCRELESEITRLSDAREALESIEVVLGHRRANRGT